jgi:PHD/YefM family antitoxin component YafN of YafNO toxin-antitoxin module
MFETRGAAAFATMGDLKNRLRETIEKAKERPVYLLRDGEPVGGLVSMQMMEILQEALEDLYIADVARKRLEAVRTGKEELLDEDEFWAEAGKILARRR